MASLFHDIAAADLSGNAQRDAELDSVVGWLKIKASAKAGDEAFYGAALRKTLDEVLDGPRTGRWDFDQLEKTEKTYVGTKLEIVLRTALELERAFPMDLEIEGVPVDIKWSMVSVWQIPREAVGHVCLCVGGLVDMTQFQVGVIRCRPEYLNSGANQDGKRTLSAVGRAAMVVLVPPAPMPSNFVTDMDPRVRDEVMAQPNIQTRVTRLFKLLPGTPIPRDAIRTVARTEGDPIRRTRADTSRIDPLDGLRILSYTKSWQAEQLGYPPLADGEFMAVTNREFMSLPKALRGNKKPDWL